MTHTPITAFVAFHLPLNTVSSVHAHRSNSVHSFGVKAAAAVGALVCV